ncbi:MAG: T9SS type A sorting domain-containing protein, partial [Bacteroidia bacterium]
VSVLVYADVAGVRNIELRSSTGTMMANLSVNIPAGQSRVTLNFNVPQGNNFQLALTSGGSLFRNASGVNYPYILNGVASITGSSAGSSFYYYFYDWEIEHNISNCISPSTTATAFISAPSGSISGLNSVYDLASFSGGVTMIGYPAGGTFSGPGVGGNIFDPATAGVGTHTITYSFTDANGCSGIVTQQVTVISTSGIFDKYDFTNAINVFPNPAKDNVNIIFDIPGTADVVIELKDVLGKTIYSNKEKGANASFKHSINTSSYETGVYFISVYISGKPHTKRIVIK